MPYGPKVIEHFTRPRNVGEMKGADGIGKAKNNTDGDVVVIYIKVAEGRVVDISFQTFGCAAAIASSSMFTEMVKGRTIEEALMVDKQQVADAFEEGMPPNKVECSIIAPDALRAAVEDYRQKRIH
jgi:nitrogen fixation protein NifU and related proteins